MVVKGRVVYFLTLQTKAYKRFIIIKKKITKRLIWKDLNLITSSILY